MRVCAVSSKVCWQNGDGLWMADGGFPIQMAGIASLFDEMDLLIVGAAPRTGGLLIPAKAAVFPLKQPYGADARRKLSVVARLPYYLLKIVRHIATADVVHVPLPGDIPALGFFMGWILRKRMIVRYCGSWADTTQTTWMNRVLKNGMKLLAGGRRVMLVTGQGAEPPAPGLHWIFATALSKPELESIRVDLDRDRSTPPRLVYLGRLSKEKGIEVLVQALANLREQGFAPLPKLTLAGDGAHRANLEAAVGERGCEDLVHFAGQLTRPEMSALLLDSDLCVQPSLTEGFSKAWLDAMAHGVPVLASNVGAAAAVIGGDGIRGWLTAPGDSERLTRKLESIFEGPVNWPALRYRCRAFAQCRSIETWAERIAEICAAQWGMATNDGKLCFAQVK